MASIPDAMLVRVLLSLTDPALAESLSTAIHDPSLTTFVDTEGPLDSALGAFAPDVLVVDGPRLGAMPGSPELATRLRGLRGLSTAPDVVLLMREATADERAAAIGAGCAAVLETGAAGLAQAVRMITSGRRRQALRLQRAAASGDESGLGDFITCSPAMREVVRLARRTCEGNSSVLILGETGVGKERLARSIHAEGPRRDQPFVVVNCAAIPETLIESELFGHEKGAFTGAHRTHRGYFEVAHRGTLLLDEIGDLPPQLQVKLLRVLQEREIQHLGGETPIPVDVRVLAATNRDLKQETASGNFRADLYYRISVVTLTIPPLRDRTEDIPLLVETYVDRFCSEMGRARLAVSGPAMEALRAYAWPGNVREVANVVERAVLLCDGASIQVEDLPDEFAPAVLEGAALEAASPDDELVHELTPAWLDLPLRAAKRAFTDAFERRYLDALLRATHGRINETATRAGIDPRSLYDKMRRLGLMKEDYRKGGPR